METWGNDNDLTASRSEDEKRWSEIPSRDEDGSLVVSPEEIIMRQNSDPKRPGIRPKKDPETIG